jgi:hypothetical protein
MAPSFDISLTRDQATCRRKDARMEIESGAWTMSEIIGKLH